VPAHLRVAERPPRCSAAGRAGRRAAPGWWEALRRVAKAAEDGKKAYDELADFGYYLGDVGCQVGHRPVNFPTRRRAGLFGYPDAFAWACAANGTSASAALATRQPVGFLVSFIGHCPKSMTDWAERAGERESGRRVLRRSLLGPKDTLLRAETWPFLAASCFLPMGKRGSTRGRPLRSACTLSSPDWRRQRHLSTEPQIA